VIEIHFTAHNRQNDDAAFLNPIKDEVAAMDNASNALKPRHPFTLMRKQRKPATPCFDFVNERQGSQGIMRLNKVCDRNQIAAGTA